ncbi:MAG: hypothetical protein Q9160_005864 [Pyrenula sp. 1 TL-2023]
MSLRITPSLRHSFHKTALRTKPVQRRWAQVHDVRFVATHRDPETVLEKYKGKLDKKAKEEGHGSISSLKEAYKDKISEFRRSATTLPSHSATSPSNFDSRQPQSPSPTTPQSQQSQTASSVPKTGIKPLSSYLDLDKIRALPNKEIEVLWRLRHAADPTSLCAVVPLDTYSRIFQTAQKHPQFILPLPRTPSDEQQPEDGNASTTAADIHFLQWSFHPPASPPVASAPTQNTHTSTILFTHLGSYKLHGTHAQPHTTVTHHLDLADSHGLVLLHGQVVPDKGVGVEEGRWLVMCLQRFYDFEVQGGEKKGKLLRSFSNGNTEGQEAFKVEELVEEAEKVA